MAGPRRLGGWAAVRSARSAGILRRMDEQATSQGPAREAARKAAAKPTGEAPRAQPRRSAARPPDTEVLEAETVEPRLEVIEQPFRAARAAAGRTFEAVGYRDYRYFWIGAMFSNIGTWMQNVAQGWLVTQLTDSAFWLGMVMFASGLPTLFLALPAGVLADRLDRRRLIIAGQVVIMLLAFWLAFLVQTSSLERGNWGLVGWVMAITFLTGAFTAVTFPSWQAMVPDLVPRETLLNAISLNSAQFHAARLIGPAIAGAFMARLGLPSAFWANAVSYLAVIWALAVIRPLHAGEDKASGPGQQAGAGSSAAAGATGASESVMSRLTGGLRYAREHTHIAVLLLSVAITTFFGMPYVILLPLFTKVVLRQGSAAYAYLMAANGFGALVGALSVAYLARVAHRPTLVRLGLIAFSVSAMSVSLARSWAVAAPIMFVAGAAFLTMTSAANTSLQAASPRHVRGRVMALFVLSFMGIMPLGSLAFGAFGHAVGVPTAVAAGASVCLVWGIVLTARPRPLEPALYPRHLHDGYREPAPAQGQVRQVLLHRAVQEPGADPYRAPRVRQRHAVAHHAGLLGRDPVVFEDLGREPDVVGRLAVLVTEDGVKNPRALRHLAGTVKDAVAVDNSPSGIGHRELDPDLPYLGDAGRQVVPGPDIRHPDSDRREASPRGPEVHVDSCGAAKERAGPGRSARVAHELPDHHVRTGGIVAEDAGPRRPAERRSSGLGAELARRARPHVAVLTLRPL